MSEAKRLISRHGVWVDYDRRFGEAFGVRTAFYAEIERRQTEKLFCIARRLFLDSFGDLKPCITLVTIEKICRKL